VQIRKFIAFYCPTCHILNVRCHVGKMKIRHLLLYILILSTLHSSGQLLNVSGKVIDERLEELPGVNIYDLDTTLLTTTDLDGTFELENSPTNLLLGFLGYEWLNISLTNDCANPEIIMLFDVNYHYKSHRKVDRLRKKRFANRVNIQEQAYEQDIFQNDESCFDYKFIPIKPELDEIRNWMNDKKIEIQEDFEQLSAGDTIYVPYSGASTNSVHSGYSNYVDYDCIVEGIVISKNKKRKGFNILYRVADLDECIYETLTHNDEVVNVGDTIQHNMRHFRLITASNKR
jgi:hypothetical protein